MSFTAILIFVLLYSLNVLGLRIAHINMMQSDLRQARISIGTSLKNLFEKPVRLNYAAAMAARVSFFLSHNIFFFESLISKKGTNPPQNILKDVIKAVLSTTDNQLASSAEKDPRRQTVPTIIKLLQADLQVCDRP